MLGRTHSAVGISCALVLNIAFPQILDQSIHPLIGVASAVTAGSIGGLLPDVDVSRSKSHNSVEKISMAVLFVGILTVFLDQEFKIGIIQRILQSSPHARVYTGMLALLAICAYGTTTKHRTFMHSISGLVTTSACVSMIAPFLVPYFSIGFISHIVIDLFNHRKIQLLFPFIKKGICFSVCKSDGVVNYMLETGATVAAAMLLLSQLGLYKNIAGLL